MKTYFIILMVIGFAATASAQTYQAPVVTDKKKPPGTPPPMIVRPMQGVMPRAFQRGGNPLQMLNPKAPARYGTWVESTCFDPNIPGKWNGIKLFEIVF